LPPGFWTGTSTPCRLIFSSAAGHRWVSVAQFPTVVTPRRQQAHYGCHVAREA